jgi:endonuclease III
MKNAREYYRKLKKLLRGLTPEPPAEIPPGLPRVCFLIEAILQADATRRQAASAMEALREEYVDLNELRVSPIRDVTDCVGRDMPTARQKAEMIATVLNNLFLRTNDISLDWLVETPRREVRRRLSELGLSPYAAAAVAMRLFGLHAVPVDQTLLECLKADGYVHPASDVKDVRAFLEKIVSPRYLAAAHEALRSYSEKRSKTLPKPPVLAPAAMAAEADQAEGLAEEEVEELLAVKKENTIQPHAVPAVQAVKKPAVKAGRKPLPSKAARRAKRAAKIRKIRSMRAKRAAGKSGRGK